MARSWTFYRKRKGGEIAEIISLEERLAAAREGAKTDAEIRAVAVLDDLVRLDPLVAKEVFVLVEDWLRQQIHGEDKDDPECDWPLSDDISDLAITVKKKFPHEGCFFCRPERPEGFNVKRDKLCPECTERLGMVLRGANMKESLVRKLLPGLTE